MKLRGLYCIPHALFKHYITVMFSVPCWLDSIPSFVMWHPRKLPPSDCMTMNVGHSDPMYSILVIKPSNQHLGRSTIASRQEHPSSSFFFFFEIEGWEANAKAHEVVDHMASFLSSREEISQPRIKPPTSSLRFFLPALKIAVWFWHKSLIQPRMICSTISSRLDNWWACGLKLGNYGQHRASTDEMLWQGLITLLFILNDWLTKTNNPGGAL